MTTPASPAFNFHNRFAMNDKTNTSSQGHDSNAEIFQFKDFSGIPDTDPNPLASKTGNDDKRSESSHISSSAESYARRPPRAANHVDTLEAAVESSHNHEGANDLERKYSSSASMYARPYPATSQTSKFQQAINGNDPRFGLPQPPSQIRGGEQSQASANHTAAPVAFPGDSDLDSSLGRMDMNGRGGRTPEPGMYATIPRNHNDDSNTRSRPSSFFGLERPLAAVDAAAGDRVFPMYGGGGEENHSMAGGLDGAESVATRGRPSSFFGMEQPMGHVPNPERPYEGPSQAARIAASHRNAELINTADSMGASSVGPMSPTESASGGVGTNSASTTRPASIAPTTSGAILDHSHLKPGLQAALLSHNKTLELYRQNAKKTNDPNLIYEFAVFMVDASKSMGGDDASGGAGSGTDYTQGKEENARDELAREAIGLLKKIAERGHMDAQYFLADCYANGIGAPKGKQDFDRAYPLFVLAAKHGHPDAAYRAGTCYEKGWGCRKDASKALQFYRKAASQSHPGAMYRLATAELNGDLGLKKSAREGVKWLKRSAESATPEFPHALHELALLHERGVDNVLFVDPEYACELLAQAAEMGYAPSAYKLGVNYEYGRMGCPQDGGLSIHMYNIAAQQNHKEACFALTAWYLVGAPGILPQSDTEAYLWAKKAAEQGLAKAEYAVGYFTEMGIGTVKEVAEARAWYRAAAEHGDKRANQRLTALGGQPVPLANELAGPTSGAVHLPGQRPDDARLPPPSSGRPVQPGPSGGDVVRRPLALSAKEQGQRVAADHAHRMILQAEQARQQQAMATQPINAPFPSAVERSGMSPSSGPGPANYPSPMAMKEAQTAQREHAFQMAVQQQHQQRMRGSPAQSSASSQRVPYGADSAYSHSSHSQQRPPPGRQGSMPPNLPPNLPPGSLPYPSYPSQNHLPPLTNSPPPHNNGATPPPGATTEKKRSLWTQIKEM